jgi:hypothetical protein
MQLITNTFSYLKCNTSLHEILHAKLISKKKQMYTKESIGRNEEE